jgi:hypothetical protein
MTFSRAGNRLAVVFDTRRLDQPPFRIQVWEVARDGQLQKARVVEPDTHYDARAVFTAAFSPEGATLVAGTAGEVLYQWDAGSGRLLRRIQGGVVAGFTPDGRTLLAVSHDGEVRRLDAATGKFLGLVGPRKRSDFLFVTRAVFSPDGKRVALGDEWTTLVKDVATNWALCRLNLPAGATPLSFSAGGETVAVASEDGTHFFDVAAGVERGWLKRAAGLAQFLGDDKHLLCVNDTSVTLREADAILAAAEKAPPPDRTDPPGVPLEAELIVRKDTYTLNLEGDTPEDFSTRVQFGLPSPESPRVDLVLRLRNAGKENLTLRNPPSLPTLYLVGPGALSYLWEAGQTGVGVMGPGGYEVEASEQASGASPPPDRVTLAPGASYAVPITKVMKDGFAHWLLPGDYQIAGTYMAEVAPPPPGARASFQEGFGEVSVRVTPAKVKVLPGKDSAAARRAAGPHEIRRPPPPGSLIVPKPDDGSGEVREQLSRPVKWSRLEAETPLKEVLELLGGRYDLDLRIDEAAFRERGGPALGRKPVTLPPVVNVSLNAALLLLLEQVDARLEIRGRTVWVVPKAK